MGHQITAMFEWMKHTDNTLNARLNDDVYADDVPAEAEVRDGRTAWTTGRVSSLEIDCGIQSIRSFSEKYRRQDLFVEKHGKEWSSETTRSTIDSLTGEIVVSSIPSSLIVVFLESISTTTNEVSSLSKAFRFRTEIREDASDSSRSWSQSPRTWNPFRRSRCHS